MTTTYSSRHAVGLAPEPQPAPTPHEPKPETLPVVRRFRRDIEGLRAVAVLAVVAYHAGVPFVGGGYVGVDVFFVISGFLITGHLYRELADTGTISLRKFYARRMTRLLPASTLVVLGTLAAAWHWMPPLSVKAITWDSLAATLYAMNYRLALQNTDYLGAQREPSPLQHFWSLAVEEQFYFVWPLLLIVTSLAWARRGNPSARTAAIVLAVLSAASFALCVWQTSASLPWAYFGLHTRAWELGLGGLVALGAHRFAGLRPRSAATLTWLGLAAIVAAVLLFTDQTRFPGYAAALPVIGAALVILGGCAAPRNGARRLLRIKPMQEIGRLSYSWYLWHWPVLIIAPHVMGREPVLWEKIALMLAALIPAAMSLAAVENRIRFHKIFRRGPYRGLLLGGGLTAVASAAALVLIQLPVPTVQGTRTATDTAALLGTSSVTEAQLQTLIRASEAQKGLPANLQPELSAAPTDFPRDGDCSAPVEIRVIAWNLNNGCEQRGFTGGGTTVVLFGDSHAQQWFDALNVVAQQQRWRIVAFTKSGCTPATGRLMKDDGLNPYLECDQWRRDALARITQLRPSMVIMSSLRRDANPVGQTGDPDRSWAQAWLTTVRSVSRSGAVPVILQDTPFPKESVPNCLSANPRAINRCNLPPAEHVDYVRQRSLREIPGARVVETTGWFCTRTTCPAVIGNTVVYRDNSHITATYSKLLGGVLGKELLK